MWTVHVVKNTVIVPGECREELNDWARKNRGDDYYYLVTTENTLYFDPDHMEHIDWISREIEAVNILSKYDVKGIVAFADFEGDGKGTIWGYQFQGVRRSVIRLNGQIVFSKEGLLN